MNDIIDIHDYGLTPSIDYSRDIKEQTNIIDGVQNVTTILEINQMFLCQPLLFLLIGLFALSVASLWMNVAKYTEQTMKEAIEKNKELKEDDGIV